MKEEAIGKIRFFFLLMAFLTFAAVFLFEFIFPIDINFTLAKASTALFVLYFVVGKLKVEKQEKE